MKFFLKDNRAINWQKGKTGHMVKACFFDENNVFYKDEKALSFFEELYSEEDFLAKLSVLNGIFLIVFQLKGKTYIVQDRARTFPLYYYFFQGEWCFTDMPDIQFVKAHFKKNTFQEKLFLSGGNTFGKETLFEDVYELQNAEILIFKEEDLHKQFFYHSFSIEKFFHGLRVDLKAKASFFLEESFKRVIVSLENRTAVVPLSGGYDSRLIAVMLKKFDYKKVICFTYGKQVGNKELELSRRVAEQLNYKWIFVEYSDDWLESCHDSDFVDYSRYAGQLSTFAYFQEYFAIRYLKEQKLIPDDSVFIPGHSGDLLGGSQLFKVFMPDLKLEKIPDCYVQTKYMYKPLPMSVIKTLKVRLNAMVDKQTTKLPYTIFEEIDIREKISKQIFNSSRVFDYFNYEKRFPYWDNSLLNYFLSLSPESRLYKNLYDELLEEKYFKPFKVSYAKELQATKRKIAINKLSKKIKPFLPVFFKKRKLKSGDWMNYDKVARMLISDIQKDNGFRLHHSGTAYNEILIQYNIFLLFYI